jgi:putative Mn2+ efflux pump MntP
MPVPFFSLIALLPLGLDTLAVSLSLGIKSVSPSSSSSSTTVVARNNEQRRTFPPWLQSALLFSLAETLMPLVGLLIGYAASLVVSSIMRYAGPLLLVGIGLWELWEEGRGYVGRVVRHTSARFRRRADGATPPPAGDHKGPPHVRLSALAPTRDREHRDNSAFMWGQQLLLALGVSLDELAIGFSLGSLPFGKAVSPLALCLYVGIQGFVMATLGIALGRGLRARLKPLEEGSELLGAFLLVGLGIWLLFF